ncbi:hypothetical protein O181_032232 [Austropuccinia psidii MF-1]|uniref:Retrovirus-related Pol polyprotein from transposon TNT 1-94-like beta-barrel domain-containing protein n=1 Tax=Austropuccinia psidii MF-1 TaxID=1389203 RepID=A0A9Q3CZ31_9BASI|nr:hypothetical protein [Austropuccinia psidii MF-1]
MAHLSNSQAFVTGNSRSTSSLDLIIDCGATHHISNLKEMFSSLQITPLLSVCTRDMSSSLSTKGIGTILIMCGKHTHTLTNCLYVPKLNCKPISLLGLGHDNVLIDQNKDSFGLLSENQRLFKGIIMKNLIKVDYSIPKALITQIPKLWHH